MRKGFYIKKKIVIKNYSHSNFKRLTGFNGKTILKAYRYG